MEQTETPVVETTNKYELMVIFLPDLGEEAVKKELAEIKKLLSNDGGDVYHEDIWGLKDLAYRIRKQDEGYYVVLNFSLPGGKVAELEHLLNIHQTVLRYLITKTPFDYKLRTLKNYEAEAEKLDKEEQKVKNEAAARKGIRKRPEKKVRAAATEPQRQSRSEAEAPSEEVGKAKTEETATAPRAEASPKGERRLPGEEEGEAKDDETATAPEDVKSEQEPAPKKPKKKAEKDDLDDFDKKLKSIIDDPDISL